jgi:hypothetical protein
MPDFIFSDRLLFGLVLSLTAAVLLIPAWQRPFYGRPTRGREAVAIAGTTIFLVITAVAVALLLNIVAGLSFILAALVTAVGAALLYALLANFRQGRAEESGLREAVQLSGKVHGVVSSGSGLLVAFTRCSDLHREGKLNLPLTGDALAQAVQRISLGQPTTEVLHDLAQQFNDIDALAEMFANYAVLSELRLDAEGRVEYTQSVAATLTALDELRGTMLEDMTITQVTRAVILFFIVPGLTLYVAFYAGGIGETLRTTVAGLVTLLINGSVYVLLPLITRRIEKMPRANL